MSDPMQDYMKSLNPTEGEQCILIYGSQYHLWRDGKYLGVAIWTEDTNVGDSFQTKGENDTGKEINVVWIADRWELVMNK